MAIVNKNLITKGLSGMLGKTLVFRKVGDKTVVSTAPVTVDHPSDGQKQQRERFQQAVLYARGQMADPVAKAAYAAVAKGAGMPNAYNIAVADFFNAPDIAQVDVSGYTGTVFDKIRIRAIDDFKVQSVTVEIQDGAGRVIEQGNAVLQAGTFDWIYTTTVANPGIAGDVVVVKAIDVPGNETVEQQFL